MRKTIRCLAAVTMAVMIFSVPVLVLPEGGQTDAFPASKQMDIELEGMTEYIEVSQYIHEGSFSAWYDAAFFRPVPADDGVKFELIENKLSEEVSFSILDISEPDRAKRPGLDEYINEYERQGYIIEAVDGTGMFPLLSHEEGTVQAFKASKGTALARVYLISAPRGEYLCTLLYPLEAAEGWGARMHQMLNTLEYLPAQ